MSFEPEHGNSCLAKHCINAHGALLGKLGYPVGAAFADKTVDEGEEMEHEDVMRKVVSM